MTNQIDVIPKRFYFAVLLVVAIVVAYIYWYFSYDPNALPAARILPPPRIALLSSGCSDSAGPMVCTGTIENITDELLPPLQVIVEWRAMHPDDKDTTLRAAVNMTPLMPGELASWTATGSVAHAARYNIRFRSADSGKRDFISTLRHDGQVPYLSQ